MDLKALKKAELIEYIEKLQAERVQGEETPDVQNDVSAELEKLREMNQALAAALQASRGEVEAARIAKSSPVQETLYPVTNVSNSMVSVEITNDRGEPERVLFRERLAVRMLTARQIREIHDKNPKIFDGGFLSAPEIIEDSPNVIRDIDGFVETLDYEDIIPRVAQITEMAPLMALYGYLENRRFVSTDANGKSLTDAEGLPTVEEVPLNAKETTLLMAVRNRLQELTKINVSVSDVD